MWSSKPRNYFYWIDYSFGDIIFYSKIQEVTSNNAKHSWNGPIVKLITKFQKNVYKLSSLGIQI